MEWGWGSERGLWVGWVKLVAGNSLAVGAGGGLASWGERGGRWFEIGAG